MSILQLQNRQMTIVHEHIGSNQMNQNVEPKTFQFFCLKMQHISTFGVDQDDHDINIHCQDYFLPFLDARICIRIS